GEVSSRHFVASLRQKKSPFNRYRLKRLAMSSRGGRSGQGGCLFNRAPIPPRRRRDAGGGTGRRVEEGSTNHRKRDDTKGSAPVSNTRRTSAAIRRDPVRPAPALPL